MLLLETESRAQIGDDRDPLKKAGDEAVDGACRADNIRGPAERSVRQGDCLRRNHGEKVASQNGSTSLDSFTKGLESGLRHPGVLEHNGAAGSAKRCLDGGNLGCGHFDQGGECSDHAGLEKFRPVEPAKDRLGSLTEPLTLTLKLEEDLKPMLPLGELLAGVIPLRLRRLSCRL